jgi:hypothetical protein
MTEITPTPRILTGTVMPSTAVDVPDPWPVIVDRWLASHTSPRTREGYTREARTYTAWCEQRGLDPHAARRHRDIAWLLAKYRKKNPDFEYETLPERPAA